MIDTVEEMLEYLEDLNKLPIGLYLNPNDYNKLVEEILEEDYSCFHERVEDREAIRYAFKTQQDEIVPVFILPKDKVCEGDIHVA